MSPRKILTVLLTFLCCLTLQAQHSKINTVVIDPGHGGTDVGALSADRKVHEADLTLSIAKKLAARMKKTCPDITVIMTREKDVTLDLKNRAPIANRAGAQLFISIHINSATAASASGPQVYSITPDKFDTTVKRIEVYQNASIFLEEDSQGFYKECDPADAEILRELNAYANHTQGGDFARLIYDALSKIGLKSNRTGDQKVAQRNFQVLRDAAMTAVLIEVGYISNPSNLALMVSDEGQDKIAQAILDAFLAYRESLDGAENAAKEEKPKEEGSEQASAVLYGVQVAAGTNKLLPKDPSFKGYTALVLRAEGEKYYKYVVCASESRADAETAIAEFKKKGIFNGCFLVKVEGDQVSRVK